MTKLTDYASKGDSASLAKIGDKPFTVIHIEDSDYENGDEVTKGVKLTTKETFDVEGEQYSKFHTTRIAIVKRFSNANLRADVNGGESLGPIKCVSEKAASGKSFFNLVDAE